MLSQSVLNAELSKSNQPKVGTLFHVSDVPKPLRVRYAPEGCSLQRLFSTFANGWPGFGLLIQRLVLGIALLYHGIALLNGIPAGHLVVPVLIGSVLGLFILAGLWTPATGALITAVQVWIALTGSGDQFTAIILAALGGTLAMIGPGAWSIDARLFGRKYIVG
jgi:putative oxidoreductase